jgi:(p)ppGpp synthase/HD superfamily hydrolase
VIVPTLEDAIELALKIHHGQVDKAGRPYILHPLRVMLGLATDEERMIGILHDVVEDSVGTSREVTLDRLRALGYPEQVVAGVDRVTRRDGESYAEFVVRAKGDPLARRVKLADIADNLDIRRLAEVREKDVERLNRYLAAWRELSD